MAYYDENGVLQSDILILPTSFEFAATLATETPPTPGYTNDQGEQIYTCNPETGLLELASEKSLEEYIEGGAYDYMMQGMINEDGYIDDCPDVEEDTYADISLWL